jgi:ketosteroid isomerase-like protein
MQKAFFLITLLASTLTLAAAPVALAQSEPAALVKQYVEAINRGDAAGVVALLADDAVFDVPVGLCAAAPCVGRDTIQKQFESLVASKLHLTILQAYVSGNVVTIRAELREDTAKKAGVERTIGWGIYETKGDKIAYVRGAIPDRSDPQTVRFFEWLRTQPPAR